MDLMSVQEVADELGISSAAIYAAVKRGTLTPVREQPLIFNRETVQQYAPNVGVRNGYVKRNRISQKETV